MKEEIPPPAPQFRKTFVLSKPVARARVYVCGLGYYELHLNGRKVGDHVLADEAVGDGPQFVLGASDHHHVRAALRHGATREEIAETVTEQSLAELIEQRLTGPLGMSDTALPPNEDTTLPDPAAHGRKPAQAAPACHRRWISGV